MDDPVIVSTYLTGEEPLKSDKYWVLPVECKGEFSYWAGFSSVWQQGRTIVNIEHDMQFSDELVTGLLDCPYHLCAYAYQVFPTQLGRYIYCATRDIDKPNWIDEGEKWAGWSSIGFCKVDPECQHRALPKQFWQWFEHSINHVVCDTRTEYIGGDVVNTRTRWHIHWPEVQHMHDYEKIPDHLW